MNTLRSTLIAAALVSTAAAGAMGLMTFGGETREASAASICAAADWPLIPAECLEGAESRPVRIVGDLAAGPAGPREGQLAMQARFDTAFQ